LFRLVIFFWLAVFSGGLMLRRRRIIANVRCACSRPDHRHSRGQEQSQQEVGSPAEAARQ
jgi:hypothetical protein